MEGVSEFVLLHLVIILFTWAIIRISMEKNKQ